MTDGLDSPTRMVKVQNHPSLSNECKGSAAQCADVLQRRVAQMALSTRCSKSVHAVESEGLQNTLNLKKQTYIQAFFAGVIHYAKKFS